MLRFANVLLGESGAPRCARCRHVDVETLRDAPDILADIRSATTVSIDGPGPNLSFTGAEPFHHPELFELLDAAVEAGVRRIRLESDAHALVDPETAEAAFRAGVRHLAFPLLGSTAEMHDSLTGVAGSFDTTVAGAKNFMDVALASKTAVHVTVRTPVCRHNLHDTPGIVTLAAKTGARSVALTIDDVDLALRRAAPWLEAACDTGVVYATWVEVEGVPYGFARGWELHLASVYHKVEGEKSGACLDCPLSDVCGGAVPGTSRSVLASLAPPSDAIRAAERIVHCFEPPRAG